MSFLTQTIYAIASLQCMLATLQSPASRRCWAKDASGRYLWVSPNFAADLRRSPDEIVGRRTEEVWPNSWRDIVRVERHVIEQRTDVLGHSEELEFPDGSYRVAVTRIPLIDDSGIVVGITGYYDAPICEAWARAERQLRLALMTDEQLDRYSAGLTALAEEFSA